MSEESKPREPIKILATNPQARHLYHLHQRLEAGIVLTGTEVKATREGRASLRDAYVTIRGHEAFLVNSHIGSYSHSGYVSHEATRTRKLLLHKREIRKLHGKLTLRGLTLIPLKLYSKAGRLKLELALAEGKKLHDKREAKRNREVERDLRRELKER